MDRIKLELRKTLQGLKPTSSNQFKWKEKVIVESKRMLGTLYF